MFFFKKRSWSLKTHFYVNIGDNKFFFFNNVPGVLRLILNAKGFDFESLKNQLVWIFVNGGKLALLGILDQNATLKSPNCIKSVCLNLWLHLINSASYDQCLYKTNIGSHILPFS